MTDAPLPHETRDPLRTWIGPAALIVLSAWAFLPLDGIPTFDSAKLVVVLGAATVLLALAAARPGGAARDTSWGDPLLLGSGVLAIAVLLAALAAGERGTLEGPLLAVAAIAAAWITARTPNAADTAHAVLRATAVAALGAGLYGCLQRVGLDVTPWAAERVPVATFGNPSFAAEYQAMALPLALALAWRPQHRLDRPLGIAASLAALAHLGLARSRIDLLAAGVAVFTLIVLRMEAQGPRKLARGLFAAGAVGIIAVALLFVRIASGAGPAWLGRSDTVRIRALVWDGTLDVLGSLMAWLPVGATFADLYPAHRSSEEFMLSLGRDVVTPHSDVLGFALTLGIIGSVFALGVVLVLGGRLLRERGRDAVADALLASLLALGVSALASSPLTHGATATLAGVVAGAALALRPALRPAGRAWISLPARPAAAVGAALLLFAFVPALTRLRADSFHALGRAALAKGEVPLALRSLDAAAQIHEGAFTVRRELGALLLNTGKPAAAARALRDAQRLRPGDPACTADLARALMASGDLDGGRTLLDAALEACAWHPELLSARAQLALVEGRGDDAERDLSTAAEMLGHDARMAALLAEARLAARPGAEHEQALAALRTLVEQDDLSEATRAVPRMLRQDESLLAPLAAMARRLVATQPEGAAALVAAALDHPGARVDVGFLTEAASVLSLAGWTEPGSRIAGRALGLRAQTFLASGQTETALRLAQKAAVRDPDPQHYVTVARALARLDQRTDAIEAVGRAIATGPVDPEALRNDPDLAKLLPDPQLERYLEAAAARLAADSGAER